MNDLISRSWLLDVVENLIQWDTEKDRNRAIHYVRELAPSAEPQKMRGKWIDWVIAGELPVIVCDQCNTFYPLQFGASHNFCPNCGAEMEQADE